MRGVCEDSEGHERRVVGRPQVSLLDPAADVHLPEMVDAGSSRPHLLGHPTAATRFRTNTGYSGIHAHIYVYILGRYIGVYRKIHKRWILPHKIFPGLESNKDGPRPSVSPPSPSFSSILTLGRASLPAKVYFNHHKESLFLRTRPRGQTFKKTSRFPSFVDVAPPRLTHIPPPLLSFLQPLRHASRGERSLLQDKLTPFLLPPLPCNYRYRGNIFTHNKIEPQPPSPPSILRYVFSLR